jgi:hypothetical protein
MGKIVKKSEYARLRGVTPVAVHRAIQSGRINLAVTEDGKIDVEKADRLWAENTSQHNGFHGQKAQREKKELLEKAKEVGISPDQLPSLIESETLRAAYRAKLSQLEYEQKIAQLVPVDDVKKEAFRLARVVRDSMFAIADRVSAELAGVSDPFVIHRRLTDEIRNAISEVKCG